MPIFGPSEADIQSATNEIEQRRKAGQPLLASEITPAHQEALKRLISQPRFAPPTSTWDDALNEQYRRNNISQKGVK